MKKLLIYIFSAGLTAFLFFGLLSCRKTENPIKFPKGTFPDSIINLSGINSAFDDYNLDIHVLSGSYPLIFSSNRGSSGGQFDLVYGTFSYLFDQQTGDFSLNTEITNDPFLSKLVTKANTSGNDFGPYRLYSPLDGFEYLILSSFHNGNLDFYYTKNLPYFGTTVPEVAGPYPVTLLNSMSNDAYICFDTNQDSAYFSSDADGNFDICLHKRPAETIMDTWLNLAYSPSSKVDILNSTGDDKCPFIFRKIMVFASNRPGGLGGYDLYYSKFSNGNWGTPVNLGPKINTASDEYRPVIGSDEEFTNSFLMFSSNRPGGKGGFDLYFTGIDLNK
jgi:WD40-like Beta Propeller Repeat